MGKKEPLRRHADFVDLSKGIWKSISYLETGLVANVGKFCFDFVL
jgi:hypothetical protein